MGEHFADAMYKASQALHFFGAYQASNALVLLSRFARLHKLETLDAWEDFVVKAEASQPEGDPR